MPVNIIWIKTHVKQILIDQFIQNWRSEIGTTPKTEHPSFDVNVKRVSTQLTIY
jgi:hypothetical protein